MIVRDENGLYVVTNKRIENTDKFRQAAIKFQKDGYYTAAPRGTSAYISYWREEGRRCLDGYTAPDGDWVTGYHYFYLNYSRILKLTERTYVDARGYNRKKIDRISDFPDFWDSDYDYFHAIELAETEGKHLAVLKARGKGYSFKGSSMLCRNFFLIRNSKSYAIASGMEFIAKDGILSKAWEIMDFINENTGWAKKRQKVNQSIHKRASYITTDDHGIETERGYMSEIMGVSLNNDSDKARGKRGKLILWEEGGKFPDLIKAWQVAQPSVEDSGVAHGLMIVFGTGGCVCAGTKVWTNEGNLVNIEDLVHSEGILGFNGKEVSKENITYWQPPTKKECYRITTNTGRTLECSDDHPILTASQGGDLFGNIYDNFFLETKHLRVGNKIAVIDEVPVFGANKMWDPRTIGWLIGDGTYGKEQSPRLSNCEYEINNFLENNYNTTIQLQRLTKENKVYRETLIKNIIPKLRELGIYGQTKLDKTLPTNIHSYCKETLCELIGGLFDTDGYVNLRYNKKRGNPIAEISISSASEKLLNEIRLVLQKLGIHGRIRERLPRKNNPKDVNSWFEFTIADTISLLRFAENIKLFPGVKQQRLEDIKRVFSSIVPHFRYEGLRYEKIIEMEFLGEKDIYNLTAGTTNTYIANGIITHNTDDSDYSGLKELFLYPDGYNILPFKNIWDDGGVKCGFFVPEYVNMYGTDAQGHPLMDKEGNTDYHIAIRHAIAKREQVLKGANDRNAIDRWVAEHPFNPIEACLQISGNIFPKEELIRHLAYIRTKEDVAGFKQVGDLEWDNNGLLKWVISHKPKDIVKYRLGKDDDKKGQIVIWEHPAVDAPHGLYIGGCLTPGEKVITNRGLINVEDITLNDKLVNKDGDFVSINTLLRYDKKDEPTYKIHMSNVNRPTKYTQEHPLYVSETVEGDFNFVEAKNVKIGMWNKYPNFYNKTKSIPFELWDKHKKKRKNKDTSPLESEDFWWFVGHWLGDGFNNKQGDNYTIYNSFGLNEIEYVNKYKEIINRVFGRSPNLKLQNGSNTHKFEHKQLYLFLEENFGKYAHGKHISEWVKFIPDNLKLQLILGYLDSDGTVYKDRTMIRSTFKSINRNLLNDIQDILFSLGIVSSFNLSDLESAYTINGKSGQTKTSYALRLSQTELKKLADKFILDFKSRKLRLAKQIEFKQKPKISDKCIISDDNNHIYIRINNIEESAYTGIVYNFDCETHTFVTQYCTGHNCDPYDHDQATTSDSLGSVFIYKRFQSFESNYDIIVAEYTGRPDTVNEFYENVRKLLTYYNARLLYENEKPGLFAYFANKHSDHLLADQPEIIKNILKDSMVRRSKGIHMTTGIKDFAELKVRDWLNEEYEPGKKNLTKVLSEPLIEELISFNREGNFDRVIALMLIMIYKEELHNRHVKKPDDDESKRKLFIKPLFDRTDVPRFIDL